MKEKVWKRILATMLAVSMMSGNSIMSVRATEANIGLVDATIGPDYAGNDIPTEGMKLTAGSLEPSEGSLEALLDGNYNTFYHSNWSGTRPTEDDFWITIELPEVTKVSGLRYLPRQSSANGRILGYEISYSVDGENWAKIDEGDWANDNSWKLAAFNKNVEAKYVKLFATDSIADDSGRLMTAAELRVTSDKLDSADASNDYPVERMTAISDSEYLPGTENEGPDDFILDGDELTHWHTNYSSSEGNWVEKRWVGVSLAEKTSIRGVRYLPRTYEGVNGAVTQYEIQYRTADDGEWITIANGTWEKNDTSWKCVTFDDVIAKQVRIVGIHTYADKENDAHMSTAEFRVISTNASDGNASDNEDKEVHATQEFIDTHVDFVKENGLYETMLNRYDSATIFKVKEYEELKDAYTAWNVARFNIFENPYDLVLADWILSTTSAGSQMEVCNMTIADNQRKIIKNMLSLIEGKVDITEQEKTMIQKLFENSGYDDVAYQICEDVFKNKLKEEDIKALFLTYDTSEKYMEILDKGENVVNSMIDVMNYCSVLDAYNATNEQFKTVLLDMCYWCADTESNPLLVSAIKSYLEIDNSDDVRTKIMQKVAGESIEVGDDIFGEQLVDRTSKFLLKNMDLSDASVAVATNVTAVVKGMKIGYDIGVAFDNAIFNSDNTAQTFVLAHASAEASEVLREVLEDRALLLRKDPTEENAVDFCETYAIYRNAQMDISNKMIKYLSENNQAFITKIADFLTGKEVYVTDSYRWLVRKARWQEAECHDAENAATDSTKRVLVACPVDVKMYDQDNNLMLSIVDDEIEYIGENVVATVRNGIKYIVIFDEDYSIEIKAAENGVMTYSVSSCDALGNVLESVHYKNIDIDKGQIFTGNLYSESAVDVERYALTSNGKKADSAPFYVPEAEEINISEIVLDVQEISLNVGDEVELKYQILPKNASLEVVTWYSEDEKIAMVDEYGTITAVGCGTTNIVCQTLDGKIESKCEVVVEDEEANDFDIRRLYGPTRYETSYAIATALKEQLGLERFDTVILANGNNFPDALAGSYLASVKDAPILMARENHKDSLHQFIKNNLNSGGNIYVLGGTGAVPDSILNGLSGYNVKRLSGQTRYETNLLILEEAGVTDEDILVCIGNAFADSLSASAAGKPILLLNNKKITEQQKEFLEEHTGNQYYIIGGVGAVSQSMENEIQKYGTIERVCGKSRYETSIEVAEEFFDTPEEVILAYAKNFPDGLCGGPLANRMNVPLILTAEKKDDVAEEYVSENDIHTGKILGGTGVLPEKTVRNIFGYVGNILKEDYKHAVNYLQEAENYLRENELEKGIEYLQKVYNITRNQTTLNFINRLEAGQYNTEGIELQLGRTKTAIYYDNNGKAFAIYENSYDDIGRWIQMKGKYDDESTSWYEEYLYDANGNHIQTDSYVQDDVVNLKHTSRYENVFDELGRCVRVNYYRDGYGEDPLMYYLDYHGESGEYVGYDQWSYDMAYYYDTSRPRIQVNYQYDSEGRKTLVEEKGQEAGINSPDWRRCTTYVYDENGKCVEKQLKYDNDRRSAETTAYIYDREGRCIQEITTYESEPYDKVIKYTYGNSLNYETEEILGGYYSDYWEYIYDELELYIGFNSKHNFSGYYFIV